MVLTPFLKEELNQIIQELPAKMKFKQSQSIVYVANNSILLGILGYYKSFDSISK